MTSESYDTNKIIRPWDDDYDCEEDENWEGVTAQDFYFAIGLNDFDNNTAIFIVPKTFWNNYSEMYDQHLDIDCLLPSDTYSLMECMYGTDLSPNDAKSEMIKHGFELSDNFQKSIDNGEY